MSRCESLSRVGWKELEVDRIKIPYTCIKLKIRRENPSTLE